MMQLLANAVIAASVYTLVGLGFATVYRVARFFNFAHAAIVMLGAYFTLVFIRLLDLNIWFSTLLAIACAALFGCLTELCIYRPLRKKGTSPLLLLLASLGIYVVVQNAVSMIFGDDTQSVRSRVVEPGMCLWGARITPIQLLTICVSLGLVVTLMVFFRSTKTGRALRAVADDPILANICGIESDSVIMWAFAIASGLAGVAGILIALDVDMTPNMGMNALLMGVVAVIVGGIGSIPGVVIGSLLIGFAENFGSWKLSSQWQDTVVFLVLLVFLAFKPQGFLGRRSRSTAV